MVAWILFSGFGIFFSNEQPNSQGYTIKQVISELRSEYSNKIEKVQTDNPHDIVVFNSPDGLLPQIKWDEVLAVYAVKTLMDPDNPTEVVTVDDSKKELLRTVFWDIVTISCSVTTEQVEQPVTSINESSNDIISSETLSVKILTITVFQIEYLKIVKKYAFSDNQKEQLNELLSNEYDSMWEQLIENGIT
ncbi:MAG: hypothetical protein ACYCYI_09860 [Saccharofermentanales bacterium]